MKISDFLLFISFMTVRYYIVYDNLLFIKDLIILFWIWILYQTIIVNNIYSSSV